MKYKLIFLVLLKLQFQCIAKKMETAQEKITARLITATTVVKHSLLELVDTTKLFTLKKLQYKRHWLTTIKQKLKNFANCKTLGTLCII